MVIVVSMLAAWISLLEEMPVLLFVSILLDENLTQLLGEAKPVCRL